MRIRDRRGDVTYIKTMEYYRISKVSPSGIETEDQEIHLYLDVWATIRMFGCLPGSGLRNLMGHGVMESWFML
jgi:hypothetical protein